MKHPPRLSSAVRSPGQGLVELALVLPLLVYNPYDTVTVTGSGDIFGAVVAKEIYVQGNTNVHVDAAVEAKFNDGQGRLRLME